MNTAMNTTKSRHFYLLGFAAILLCDTVVQLSFKAAGDHAFPPQANLAWVLRVLGNPWVYVALAGYLGNFFTWMTLLKHAPIGPAFAATHLQVVSVMLCSAWLFHEPLPWPRLLGAAIIMAGIACLAVSEGDKPAT